MVDDSMFVHSLHGVCGCGCGCVWSVQWEGCIYCQAILSIMTSIQLKNLVVFNCKLII